MHESDNILEAARSIRPYLSELLEPATAETLDQQLADLLVQANAGQPVENHILELLAAQDASREWMYAFLHDKHQPEILRSWSPLPGQPSIVDSTKFVCSQGDYTWYRPRVGVNPPNCPTHNIPLEEEA